MKSFLLKSKGFDFGQDFVDDARESSEREN